MNHTKKIISNPLFAHAAVVGLVIGLTASMALLFFLNSIRQYHDQRVEIAEQVHAKFEKLPAEHTDVGSRFVPYIDRSADMLDSSREVRAEVYVVWSIAWIVAGALAVAFFIVLFNLPTGLIFVSAFPPEQDQGAGSDAAPAV